MNPDDLRRRVAGVEWFHTIDLGHGIVTPGIDDTPRKLLKLGMPDDLDGRTVLDIGAWDGFFSFEAARRGARRVLATDSFCWRGEAWGSKRGFELAREALNAPVEDKTVDVMDLSPDIEGVFDVVLFLGVLYHLRHPLLALESVARVAGDLLILETEVDLLGLTQPAMAFYAGTELNNDPTNWWAPNPAALLAMLSDVGFARFDIVSHPKPLALRAGRALKQWFAEGKNPLVEYRRDRLVVHAWK
jgi:tRNA (mo5U34)-methyltransferase